MSDLSDNKNSGRISGFAWGLGFVGGLLALFICFILFDFNDSTSVRKMNVFVVNENGERSIYTNNPNGSIELFYW